MTLTENAMKNIKDYDIYVKVWINVNDELEYGICNNSDDMVICDNIWNEEKLNSVLEHWGEED